jgi:sulfur carrier protein
MKIVVNGEVQDVSAKNLSELLESQDFGSKVATALNGTFVPIGARASTALSDGDLVEILSPMQGG